MASLAWLDTRDMVADGLNKGTIDRDALREASQGIWQLRLQPKAVVRKAK